MVLHLHLFSTLRPPSYIFLFFFFNDTATTEIYTLSLHDALPICPLLLSCSKTMGQKRILVVDDEAVLRELLADILAREGDRKSTRLNSSHQIISYAVFCLKKKKKTAVK